LYYAHRSAVQQSDARPMCYGTLFRNLLPGAQNGGKLNVPTYFSRREADPTSRLALSSHPRPEHHQLRLRGVGGRRPDVASPASLAKPINQRFTYLLGHC
jgi:hypothetical protein